MSDKPDKYPWTVGMQVTSVQTGVQTGMYKRRTLGKIVRLTKTQFVVEFKTHQQKYHRTTGERQIDSWSREEIHPTTQEDINAILKAKLVYQLKHETEFHPLTLDQLERIYKITVEKQENKE